METKSKRVAPSKTPSIRAVVTKSCRSRSTAKSIPQPTMPVSSSSAEGFGIAPIGKQSQLLTLLQSDTGATMQQMMETTGWQAHSVRGYISAVFRKKMGLQVERHTVDSISVYRIGA